MAKAKKQKTQAQKEYAKELKRIKQFISRAEKRGFIFPESAAPKALTRPTRRSVERLKMVTPETLYAKAKYGGEASFGEVVSATEGLKLERKLRSQRAAETRKAKKLIKENYGKQQPTNEEGFAPPEGIAGDDFGWADTVITEWWINLERYNETAQEELGAWLRSAITASSKEDVARMLQYGAEHGLIVDYKIVYSEPAMSEYMARMLDFLDVSDFSRRRILEDAEYREQFISPF